MATDNRKTVPALNWQNAGANVQVASDGQFAYVRMDISDKAISGAAPSKSGKTRLVAGSGGFVGVPDHEELRLSLNLTTK